MTRIIILLALVAMLGLAGCATPYTRSQSLGIHHQIGVAEGVRLAARAAQEVGYLPSIQNEAAGFVTAERQRKEIFNLDMYTLYLTVRFARDASDNLRMDATCAVSQNMAYTDELDDECEKFYAAFNRLLYDRGARRAPPAPPERRLPADPPRPPPQAPAKPLTPPPSEPPAQGEYKL